MRTNERAALLHRFARAAPRAASLAVHGLVIGAIYQAHLTPPPPLAPVREIELVEPLFTPPPPPPPPPPERVPAEPPPQITRARAQPRAAATPPPEAAQTEALPAPPAPPAPADAPIGETIAREAWVRNARPIHRPEPKYPRRAARASREGSVTLRFTILASGAVANVEIVDADPPGWFEEAAAEAVSRWRYAPCEWNGVHVAVPGVLARLRFELES